MPKAWLARGVVPTMMASNLMVRRKGIADSGLEKAYAPEETFVLGEARMRRPKLGPEPKARATKRAKGAEETQAGATHTRTTQLLSFYTNFTKCLLDYKLRSVVEYRWFPRRGGQENEDKKKGGGIEPILEHHNIIYDPSYMKPPLPTHIK